MLDTAIPQARNTRRFSGRRTLQNAAPAFLVNDSGIPAAATGPVYPEWAMVALAPWCRGAVGDHHLHQQSPRTPPLPFQALDGVGRRSTGA
ncbi:hypothetical protein ABDK96_15725 [Citricoccus nitrophenolicus]|uniref:Uncharacterized protein n=1 Tax=Citricoccus nitrophenolicus TaxID=863575 RepID=A0ABV0ILS5_9MICC